MDLKKYKLRFILLMIYKAKMDSAKFGTVHFTLYMRTTITCTNRGHGAELRDNNSRHR